MINSNGSCFQQRLPLSFPKMPVSDQGSQQATFLGALVALHCTHPC